MGRHGHTRRIGGNGPPKSIRAWEAFGRDGRGVASLVTFAIASSAAHCERS